MAVDDIDEQFQRLVAQIGPQEQRRMRASARSQVPRRSRWRVWIAVVLVVLAVAVGVLVTVRPDLLSWAAPALSKPPAE